MKVDNTCRDVLDFKHLSDAFAEIYGSESVACTSISQMCPMKQQNRTQCLKLILDQYAYYGQFDKITNTLIKLETKLDVLLDSAELKRSFEVAKLDWFPDDSAVWDAFADLTGFHSLMRPYENIVRQFHMSQIALRLFARGPRSHPRRVTKGDR